MPQAEEAKERPPKKGVNLDTTEPRQPPKSLPPMVELICQAHRRLKNLLVSFTSKAPLRFVNQMNDEFFRVQREAILQQDKEPPGETQIKVLLEAQGAQLQHLATQLANSEGLNDLNIEAIFHLEEKSTTLQQKLYQATEEVLSPKGQKGEAIAKLQGLQDKMDAKIEQIGCKDQEISHLNNRNADMNSMLQRADNLIAN